MAKKRERDKAFIEAFGCTMTEVGTEIGKSRESISMIFRNYSASTTLLQMVREKLVEIRDKNYMADIQTADYRRQKATDYIDFIDSRISKNGQRKGKAND